MAALLATCCAQRIEFEAGAERGGTASSGSGGAAGATAGQGGTRPGCVTDGDCQLTPLHCEPQSGACVECLDQSHCQVPGLARCDAALHRCVECGVEQDCAEGWTCDTRTRRCALACTEDTQCPATAHGCDEERQLCEECETESDGENEHEDDCQFDPTRPFCSADTFCVACLTDADCSGGHCDTLVGRCRECRDSRDCIAPAVCDPSTYTCATR